MSSIIQIGDSLVCTESALMAVPAIGSHARQIEFRFPPFQNTPVVTTTVYTNQALGTAFAVWKVNISPVDGQTQIIVFAENVQIGVGILHDYFCDIVVIGRSVPLQ